MKSKISVYLASGNFTPRTNDILNALEAILSARPDVDLYSPFRDGFKLEPGQKHDTSLREKIFEDNLDHIRSADLVIANIDSVDSYNDTGTIYEVGYAMSMDIPVIGFTLSQENIKERFRGFLYGFDAILSSYEEINTFFDEIHKEDDKVDAPRVLFVGCGNDIVDSKIASNIIDSGYNIRWVNDSSCDVYSNIDDVFNDVDFMLAVIDDRRTLVSWMLGQAYSREVPIVTYSDHNYGVNVMLLMSIRAHIRGCDELVQLLQKVKREGLESIPKLDTSSFTSM